MVISDRNLNRALYLRQVGMEWDEIAITLKVRRYELLDAVKDVHGHLPGAGDVVKSKPSESVYIEDRIWKLRKDRKMSVLSIAKTLNIDAREVAGVLGLPPEFSRA